MESSELSNKAKEICDKNYKYNCGSCPIRPECVSKIGHGSEGLEKWITKVNQAAENVKE